MSQARIASSAHSSLWRWSYGLHACVDGAVNLNSIHFVNFVNLCLMF